MEIRVHSPREPLRCGELARRLEVRGWRILVRSMSGRERAGTDRIASKSEVCGWRPEEVRDDDVRAALATPTVDNPEDIASIWVAEPVDATMAVGLCEIDSMSADSYLEGLGEQALPITPEVLRALSAVITTYRILVPACRSAETPELRDDLIGAVADDEGAVTEIDGVFMLHFEMGEDDSEDSEEELLSFEWGPEDE